MKSKIKTTAKVTKKIIHVKLMLLVLMILPLAVFTLLTSKSSILAGIRSMVVLSGSMEPTMHVGSVVYVMPQSTYSKGDIISFTNDAGATVTHRIAEITKSNGTTVYQTKGDANKVQDSQSVSTKNVIGKMFISIPYVGFVIEWLKTPAGFLIAVILPTVIFVAFELWAIKGEIEKNIEKQVRERLQSQT